MQLDAFYWLEFLLLPPGLLLLFAIVALILLPKGKKYPIFILSTGILLVLLVSMPVVARALVASLQIHSVIDIESLQTNNQPMVLVVLGGGRYPNAPEYGEQDQISPATLERLRYAARLSRQIDHPLLLTGGRRNADSTAEAVMMNQVLVDEYNIHPTYLEVNASNTQQQAIEVKSMLTAIGIDTVVLITHAWHMPRAVAEFQYQGMTVIPAPMGYLATADFHVDYQPSAAAMAISSRALHEHYALFWQSIVHQNSQ